MGLCIPPKICSSMATRPLRADTLICHKKKSCFKKWHNFCPQPHSSFYAHFKANRIPIKSIYALWLCSQGLKIWPLALFLKMWHFKIYCVHVTTILHLFKYQVWNAMVLVKHLTGKNHFACNGEATSRNRFLPILYINLTMPLWRIFLLWSHVIKNIIVYRLEQVLPEPLLFPVK